MDSRAPSNLAQTANWWPLSDWRLRRSERYRLPDKRSDRTIMRPPISRRFGRRAGRGSPPQLFEQTRSVGDRPIEVPTASEALQPSRAPVRRLQVLQGAILGGSAVGKEDRVAATAEQSPYPVKSDCRVMIDVQNSMRCVLARDAA